MQLPWFPDKHKNQNLVDVLYHQGPKFMFCGGGIHRFQIIIKTNKFYRELSKENAGNISF